MKLKKKSQTIILTDPIQIAAYKKAGYEEVKARGNSTDTDKDKEDENKNTD